MDFVTFHVHYVQDSSMKKPLPLLDITPVTAEDRARVLGARCGSPRYAPGIPFPPSRSETDQDSDEDDEDSELDHLRDYFEGGSAQDVPSNGDGGAPACGEGPCNWPRAASSSFLEDAAGKGAKAPQGIPLVPGVSPGAAPSAAPPSSEHLRSREGRLAVTFSVIPGAAGSSSPDFSTRRAELLGSACGTPRMSAAMVAASRVKRSSSCKDCLSQGMR